MSQTRVNIKNILSKSGVGRSYRHDQLGFISKRVKPETKRKLDACAVYDKVVKTKSSKSP